MTHDAAPVPTHDTSAVSPSAAVVTCELDRTCAVLDDTSIHTGDTALRGGITKDMKTDISLDMAVYDHTIFGIKRSCNTTEHT